MGWLVVDLGQAQKAYLMFYDSPLEASRVLDQGGSVALKDAASRGNVLLGYEAAPTPTEKSQIENCIA